jgi:hypothetical protein
VGHCIGRGSKTGAAQQGGAMLNNLVLNNIRIIEMIGVVMRIFSFSLVSWLGPESPFLFVWIFNTIDAVLLSWCAILKKDAAYSLLNLFWIMVGVVGILRTLDVLHYNFAH